MFLEYRKIFKKSLILVLGIVNFFQEFCTRPVQKRIRIIQHYFCLNIPTNAHMV